MNINHTKKGDCEFCQRVDVVLTMQHGDMMCDECIAKENAITASINNARKIVEDARKQDDSIQLNSDVWNAATVSFTELDAAIKNNPEIPSTEKQFALVNEAAIRIQKLNAAIFEHESAGMKMKNERHSWVTQTNEAAAKLSAEHLAKFRQYDLTYTSPGPTKKEKSTKSPSTSSSSKRIKFSKEDLAAAVKKYNVNAVLIQMTAAARNITPDAAAQVIVELNSKKAK
jgi:hypothetical protein